MAKVTDPYDTFKNTKRLGQRLLLKNRREGNTITLQSLTKKMVFTTEKWTDNASEEITKNWNALSSDDKQHWRELGAEVFMEGETLFRQEEKKRMINGFYNIATYGATRYKGIAETKYSRFYKEAVYGLTVYRNK